MKTQLSPQDWQQLSAYVDGQLSTTEKQRLETRLATQVNLRNGLAEISQTRAILRSVPRRKAPHNFILTRAMVTEQTRRRSAWFPALSFTSLVSVLLLAVVSILSQLQSGAMLTVPAAPVAMQADRSADQAGAPTAQPMIIQWGNGGIGSGGGGDGGALPQSANPLGSGMGGGGGGGQPQETQSNSLMKGQATPEAGVESAPAATEAGAPNLVAPNDNAPTVTLVATPEPVLIAPPLEATPTPAEGAIPGVPSAAPVQAQENTPTPGAVAQEKTVPDQAGGPVILGIAPTQDQGLIQNTPPVLENTQAPSAPFNFLPFVQVGLIALALVAGILAFLLRKKT